MPDGAWLGLHVTVDIGGRCKFGPDIEWIPEIDYSFEPQKLNKFLGFIRTYYPGLEPSRLHADYTGIRPKLYREGEPVPDFLIHGPAVHGTKGLVSLVWHREPGPHGVDGDRRSGAGYAALSAEAVWIRGAATHTSPASPAMAQRGLTRRANEPGSFPFRGHAAAS